MITASNQIATVEKQANPSFCIMRKIEMALAASDFEVLQDVDEKVYLDTLRWQLLKAVASFSTLSSCSTLIYCNHPIRPKKAAKRDCFWKDNSRYMNFIGKTLYWPKLRNIVDFLHLLENSCMHSQAFDWLSGMAVNGWLARLLNFHARFLRVEANDVVNRLWAGNTINSTVHGRSLRARYAPKIIGSRS